MTEQKKDDRTKENKNKKRTTNLFTNKNKREMKTRTLFVTALLGLGMMASCSNDELEGVDNGQNNNGETTLTQIALTVSSNANTRVNGNTGEEQYGEEYEYTVEDLTVVFANEAGIAQQVIQPAMKEATNVGDDDKLIRVSVPFSVTPGDYYIYVLANYNNSQNALSPIITNQTDMKQVFNISNPSTLSTNGKFLMANTTAPTKTTIAKGDDTATEVKDDGTEVTNNPQKVKLITVDIERVVAKVTFDQTTTSFEVKESEEPSATKVADVTLNGNGLINLNKKMYLVKGDEKSTNKPVTGKDWAYPEDPNYSTVLSESTDNSTWINDNFSTPEATISDGFDSKFYCPENTMTAQAQQQAQTTGVVYKATWTPASGSYTELAASNGTSTFDARYEAVLGLSGKNAAITNSIFTTKESQDSKDFYTYNDLIFISYNAACLYKAIAEYSGDDTNMASTINTNFGTYSAQSNVTTQENTYGIYKYIDGTCYYTVWIKHNPTTEVSMEQGKYGVVRNHWYDLTVTSISQLGYNKPTYEGDPEDPDDPEEVKIQVEAKIKKWMLVKQNVEL